MRKLNVKRLDVTFVETKLNNLVETDPNSQAFLTLLTLNQKSAKYGWASGCPFPAIVKTTSDGNLAVYNCITSKTEVLPEGSYKQPTPVKETFEYKGCRYRKNPVYDIYTLDK